MSISDVMAYFGAICGTVAVLPQIIRVIKLKEANALSYLFISLRMVAFFSFMISIALTGHYLMASSYILIISVNCYLAFLKFHYARK
jgi:uncharacterized protein with PQ loop repeat